MRIAVTYENGEVFQEYGKTTHFKLYDAKSGAIRSSMCIEALGCGDEALTAFLGELRVSTLICGNIDGRARAAVEAAGIVLYGGVHGSADAAVEALLAGTLHFDPEIHLHCRGDGGCSGCTHDCDTRSCPEHHCSSGQFIS